MKLTILLAVAVVATSITQAELPSQTLQLELDGSYWDARGDWQVGEVGGRMAMSANNGTAVLAGADLRDGTVSFDVRAIGIRSFGGIRFRNSAGVSRSEYFYVRPHQTARFDAVQYTPVLNLQSQWQLFGEYNVSTPVPADTWLTFRLEFRGNTLRIFTGDDTEPLLVAHDLDRDASGSGLALTVFTPPESPAMSGPTMAFSNVRFEAAGTAPSSPPPAVALPGTALTGWSVSSVAPAVAQLPDRIPENSFDGSWTPLELDHAGRLLIGQLHPVPQGGGMVLAKTTIRRAEAGRAKLWLGMSDRGVVFVNGQPVLRSENSYLSRSGRYLGTMTADKDAVYIDLESGDNELVFLVAESFGGWGLTARIE